MALLQNIPLLIILRTLFTYCQLSSLTNSRYQGLQANFSQIQLLSRLGNGRFEPLGNFAICINSMLLFGCLLLTAFHALTCCFKHADICCVLTRTWYHILLHFSKVIFFAEGLHVLCVFSPSLIQNKYVIKVDWYTASTHCSAAPSAGNQT